MMTIMIRPVVRRNAKSTPLGDQKLDGDDAGGNVADDGEYVADDGDYGDYYGDVADADDDDHHDKDGGKEECQVSTTR